MKIVFDCGTIGPQPHWCDEDLEAGIGGVGGSEEALIYLTRELSKLGHEIIVRNNCQREKTIFTGNGDYLVTYIDYHEDLPDSDVVIAHRNWYLLINILPTRKKILSCHDIPDSVHCPTESEVRSGALNYIDRVVLLNQIHSDRYPLIPEEKKKVIPAGIIQKHFNQSVKRIPHRVLYFSEPNRGLELLINMWPLIRKEVPDAELASFWWDKNCLHGGNTALGILPMRVLRPEEVSIECMKADVFAYPSTSYIENFCSCLAKAQLGGAFPVIVPQGGMMNTLSEYGVACTYENFPTNLIRVLKDDYSKETARPKIMEWAKEQFDWKKSAFMWQELCENL